MTLAKNKLFAVAALPRNSENEQPGRNVGSGVSAGRTGSKPAPVPQHPVSSATAPLVGMAWQSLLAQQGTPMAPIGSACSSQAILHGRGMEMCPRTHQGWGQSVTVPSLPSPAPDWHGTVLTRQAGRYGTQQHRGILPRRARPPAPREGCDGTPGGTEAGGHSPLRAAVAAGGLAQVHLQGPLGKEERSQPHHHRLAPPNIPPMMARLLISSALGQQGHICVLPPWGRESPCPPQPGQQLGHPAGAGAAAGRVSSADPAG